MKMKVNRGVSGCVYERVRVWVKVRRRTNSERKSQTSSRLVLLVVQP